MSYKDKTKEKIINELAEPHQPIEYLAARESGHRQAAHVSNVYLFDHKGSIFRWHKNK